MAYYVLDMSNTPPVVVVVTDDDKEANRIASAYGAARQSDIHVVEGHADVVKFVPVKPAPITDPAMAIANNVLPMRPEPSGIVEGGGAAARNKAGLPSAKDK